MANPSRLNHPVAKSYVRGALEHGVPLHLSAIVASELQIKQSVTDLPLRNFEVLPFNIDHAMPAGLLYCELRRDVGDDRAFVQDDVKLIAQAVCQSLTHVLTEDEQTLTKYVRRLSDAGQCSLRCVLLAHGYDPAWFDNGQMPIPGT